MRRINRSNSTTTHHREKWGNKSVSPTVAGEDSRFRKKRAVSLRTDEQLHMIRRFPPNNKQSELSCPTNRFIYGEMTQDTPDLCHGGAARIVQRERHGSGKDCVLNRHLHTTGVIQARHRWQPGLVPLTQVRFPGRKGWSGGGCVQWEHWKQVQTGRAGQVETWQKRD